MASEESKILLPIFAIFADI